VPAGTGMEEPCLTRGWDPFRLEPAQPSSVWTRPRVSIAPEDSPCYRNPSTPRTSWSPESKWTTEATELLGQGPVIPSSLGRRESWDPKPWALSLPEESRPTGRALTPGTQVRVGLPGVMTEAKRVTGGSSFSQRQLGH
jgi:hypothetical protein